MGDWRWLLGLGGVLACSSASQNGGDGGAASVEAGAGMDSSAAGAARGGEPATGVAAGGVSGSGATRGGTGGDGASGSETGGDGASGSAVSDGGADNGGSTDGSAGNGGAGNGSGGNDGAGMGGTGSTGGSSTGGSSLGTGGMTSDHWRPSAGLSWQWQLSESVGEPLDVDVYDIDWETDAEDVERLHAQGIHVICYVSVGSWEDFRPDADAFPESVIGNDYDGWPGEKYVDIRSEELRALMLARFDVCQEQGFDAIEPDNMDVFELGSDSGFPLTQADGIEYALFLAEAAHTRGLGIGQKNASSITDAISAEYEWALTESCYSDGDWCGDLDAYVDEGKPVFMCEYEADSFADACATWQPEGYSPILKGLDLDEPIEFCP